ncbi:MAG: carboxypeptidase regulatory-like domain-containing protein [Candidatus Dependentiae bacterium]|nr:carboxypeptidase regulatory-like domain-containing protein [Candidatus Dependentiae bacterium]
MKKIFYYIMLFFCVCLAPHYASAAAIIAGTVTDSVTGLPISGALVEAFRGNQVRYSTTTIGDGTYSLSGIEPSVYTLIISAPGYQTQSVGVNPRNGQVTIVDIALVPNGGTISGTVTNAITTLPIAGATIEVFQDNTLIGQATTNGSGGYSVPNLAPGNYVVLATAAGFESHVEGANVQVSAITVVDFALATTPGSIAGTITDSVSTNPIVGAVVQVFDGTILVNFADTDGSGNYTFADLAPGSYTVVASAADYQSKAVGAIVVASATTTVDIALNSNPGSITGLVTNAANGAGIAGSVVEVFQNHTFIASALTDENGNYSITGLAAGDYIVVAGATNFGTASTGATVTANNSTVVDFVLSGVFGSISGTVTDATTTDPIAGVTIGIFDGPEFLVSVITDANGNYQVDDLTPGDYTVIATASNYQIQTKTATVNSNTTTVVNFALASNPGSLSGTVTDATTNNCKFCS